MRNYTMCARVLRIRFSCTNRPVVHITSWEQWVRMHPEKIVQWDALHYSEEFGHSKISSTTVSSQLEKYNCIQHSTVSLQTVLQYKIW